MPVNPLMQRAAMYAAKCRKHALPSEEADVSPAKAKKILEHGEVQGHPLTKPQEGMFGAIAGKEDYDKSPGTQAIEEVNTEIPPEDYEFDESKHPRDEGGEFTLSNKPKKKAPAIETKKGKQQPLFNKSGKAGQMNLFADKAVPDEWTPEGIKKKKAQGGLFALHAGLIADVIRYARATGGQKGLGDIKSDVPRQGQFVWRTIGGDKGAPEGHKGGSPVLIDVSEGKIVGGPKSLEGRTLKSLDKNVAGTSKDKRKQAEPPKQQPPTEQPAKKKRERQREYSDQEIGEREAARNYNEVMADPQAASDQDLSRAYGWAQGYRRHLKRKLDRGEISADQYDTHDDSLAREQQNIRRILRDREEGTLKPGPEQMTRGQKIAERAVLENANVWTIAKGMGLTRQEIMELMPEISDEIEKHKQAMAEEKPPSDARKRAQDAARRKRAEETPEGRPKPKEPEQPAEEPDKPESGGLQGRGTKGLPDSVNPGELADLAKQKLGKRFAGIQMRKYGDRHQLEVLYRKNDGSSGRAATYSVEADQVEAVSQQVKGEQAPAEPEQPAETPAAEPEAPKQARSSSEISAERKQLFDDYKAGKMSVDEYDDRDTALAKEQQRARQQPAAPAEPQREEPAPKPKPKRKRAPGDPYGRTLTSRLRNRIAKELDSNDPRDIEGFHQGMTDTHKQMTEAVETHNDALRNLLGQFGIDTRQKLSGFQKSVRAALAKGADADGIQRAALKVADRGPVPRALSKLDQMVDMARRSPELTQERTAGEAEEQDIESSLLETIRKGPRKAPRFTSDEVFEKTWEMLGRYMGPSEDVQGQEEPDEGFPWEDEGEEVPFSLARVKQSGAWELFRFRVLHNIATLYRT